MAAKGKKKKAETIFLVCEESGDYNYTVRRKPGGEKLRLGLFVKELSIRYYSSMVPSYSAMKAGR